MPQAFDEAKKTKSTPQTQLITIILIQLVILIIWLVLPSDCDALLAIRPRHFYGLLGIITSPFIHASAAHIWGNLFGITTTALGICLLYPKHLLELWFWVWLLGGALVWLLARPALHVGASGWVYGGIGYLLVSAAMVRSRAALAVALLTIILHQGLIWGLLPYQPGVSHESHLYAAIVGGVLAWHHRRQDPKPPDIDETETEPPDNSWDYEKYLDQHHKP